MTIGSIMLLALVIFAAVVILVGILRWAFKIDIIVARLDTIIEKLEGPKAQPDHGSDN